MDVNPNLSPAVEAKGGIGTAPVPHTGSWKADSQYTPNHSASCIR